MYYLKKGKILTSERDKINFEVITAYSKGRIRLLKTLEMKPTIDRLLKEMIPIRKTT